MSQCERFSGNPKAFKFCNRVMSETFWLKDIYPSEGLGMQEIIDDYLFEHKVGLSDEEKVQEERGFNTLLNSKYPISVIDCKLKRDFGTTDFSLIKDRIVQVKDEDGNYHYVNKLNTNYKDLAELLTKMFVKVPEMYKYAFKGTKNIKEGLLKIRKHIPRILNEHFTVEEIKDFTHNSMRNTDIGDDGEDAVSQYLQSKGFVENYVGGNGSFIDMKFGVDLIMSNDEGVITIQVKPNNPEKWLKNGQYKNVDWIVTYRGGIKIYDNKSKEEITDTLNESEMVENFYKTGKL